MPETDLPETDLPEIDLRTDQPVVVTAQRCTARVLLRAAQEAAGDCSLQATEARALATALAWDAENQLARLDLRDDPSPAYVRPEARVLPDRRAPADRAPLPGAPPAPATGPAPEALSDPPVGVATPAPEGLVSGLVALGFPAEAVEDPEIWAKARAGGVLLLSLDLPEALTRLWHLKAIDPDLIVVGLLEAPGISSIRSALQSGADGVTDRDAPPAKVARAIFATLDGHLTLPLQIARELLTEDALPRSALPISETEVTWLRMLADGATVPAVARSAGRSERDMFRLLRRLYSRLEVTSRTEAILKAGQAGLLEARPAPPVPSNPPVTRRPTVAAIPRRRE